MSNKEQNIHPKLLKLVTQNLKTDFTKCTTLEYHNTFTGCEPYGPRYRVTWHTARMLQVGELELTLAF